VNRTLGGSREAVRFEIVSAARNYLSQRLDLQQNDFLNKCTSFLLAPSMKDFLKHGVEIMRTVYPNEVQQFCNDVCDSWPIIEIIEFLPHAADHGAQLSSRLCKLIPSTNNSLQKCFASIMVLAPHSMQTERMVSVHNKIVTAIHSTIQEETVNARMQVALNSVGTSSWDPREAVAEFLKRKERHKRNPEFEVYLNRKFVSKFFRKA
jgi:hypothetical protein